MLGHQARVARFPERGRRGNAKPHAVERLRAITCNRVGEVPVEQREFARTRESKRQRPDRKAGDPKGKKDPRAARNALADVLELRIPRDHLLERFQVDGVVFINCFGVWTE